MSTSSDAPKGGSLAGPLTDAKIEAATRNPGLTLLRGIAWIAVIAAGATVLGMNYEIVWDLLSEGVPLLLEVIEESLDTFYEAVVKLTPAFAQMATAYTGFVLALILLYLLTRKAISIYKKTQAKKSELAQVYGTAWKLWSDSLIASIFRWWNSLDLVNKFVAGTALVLIGIPLALLLSYLLGSLVASLL